MYITPDEFISSYFPPETAKETFNAMDDEEKQGVIYRASMYIDLSYQGVLKGHRDQENEFEFPRLGSEDVPRGVKSSTIVAASMMLAGADLLGVSVQQEQAMTKVKVGPIAVDYADAMSMQSIYSPPALIDSMMKPYICAGNNPISVVSYL